MRKIRLLDLGTVSALRSQTVYHAVAHAMTEDTPDTIILVSPAEPYVCIGYHQELDKEVDLDYCRAHGLPVYRREVGGGAVYLDDGQLFAQWIFQQGQMPAAIEDRYTAYIQPLVDTYQALGINAYRRPINDVHVGGKKIGGTGAAQMGQAEVAVGSLMFTFDKATMARVLKVASEKMRDKVFESLEQYMTTMKEQLVSLPDRQRVKDLYVEKCAAALNAEIVAGDWTPAEEAMAASLDKQFVTDAWLLQKSGLRQTGVKISQDVQVVEKALKAPGGLIRVTARLREGRIDDVALSGDFTLLPAVGLAAVEHAVRGASLEPADLMARISAAYQTARIQSPGVTPDDFARAIAMATSP